MSETVERFSNRVDNYVKYRPSYPAEMLEVFRNEMNLRENSVIADIGSGTGISSKTFLEAGCRVIGVEPNTAMRAAAEEFLRDFPRFESVNGTAEQTNLPAQTVDLIIAAQAFHWFDVQKTPLEFKRILRDDGFVALIWNERQIGTNEFLREYEQLLKKYGRDYEKVRHDRLDKKILENFFQREFSLKTYPNAQTLDFQGLRGRIASSSYMPPESDPLFEPMTVELRGLFDNHSEKGRIKLLYDTNIFYTRF